MRRHEDSITYLVVAAVAIPAVIALPLVNALPVAAGAGTGVPVVVSTTP